MQSESTTIAKATDPTKQCQAVTRTGQCTNEVVMANGIVHKFCLNHGGSSFIKKQEEQALNNYRLNKFQARLKEMRSSSSIKDLRDEIGILRLMLEERFNSFANSNEMILQSGAIGELVMKIEKLVTSCHKLDEKTKLVVDKAVVITIAEQLIASISRNVKDTEATDKIIADFTNIMNEQSLI